MYNTITDIYYIITIISLLNYYNYYYISILFLKGNTHNTNIKYYTQYRLALWDGKTKMRLNLPLFSHPRIIT